MIDKKERIVVMKEKGGMVLRCVRVRRGSAAAEPRSDDALLTLPARTGRHWLLRRHGLGVLLIGGAGLLAVLPLFSAFEAHVINVTAQIESPAQCDARGLHYWSSSEGCSRGQGLSPWASNVNALSVNYSGVFAFHAEDQICRDVWIPNCRGEDRTEMMRCFARAQILALELNVASSHLDPAALLGGADTGGGTFGDLGLSNESTIDQALGALEQLLSDPGASLTELHDAMDVASRIIWFYESKNPFAPKCVYDPFDVPYCVWNSKEFEKNGTQAVQENDPQEVDPEAARDLTRDDRITGLHATGSDATSTVADVIVSDIACCMASTSTEATTTPEAEPLGLETDVISASSTEMTNVGDVTGAEASSTAAISPDTELGSDTPTDESDVN